MSAKQSTVLHNWFNEVWNKDDIHAIKNYMTDECYAHGIFKEGQPKGTKGFELFFQEFRSQFQDINIEIDQIITQGDLESALNTVHATDIATGKRVVFAGICMVRVKDGKIDEAWNNYDFLSMYQQIGYTLVKAE